MWKIYSERAIADVYIQPRATTRWGGENWTRSLAADELHG